MFNFFGNEGHTQGGVSKLRRVRSALGWFVAAFLAVLALSADALSSFLASAWGSSPLIGLTGLTGGVRDQIIELEISYTFTSRRKGRIIGDNQPDSGTSLRIRQSLDRLAAGEPAARGELLDHARRRLESLTRHMLRDYARLKALLETDDVLQQALMRLHRALGTGVPTSIEHFFSLATLEIRRELIDLARHYFGPAGWGKLHAPGQGSSSRGTPEPTDPSEHMPQHLAQWAEFHEAVARLPERQREAFELCWYHGLQQIEAAGIMQCSTKQLGRYLIEARLGLANLVPGLFENE